VDRAGDKAVVKAVGKEVVKGVDRVEDKAAAHLHLRALRLQRPLRLQLQHPPPETNTMTATPMETSCKNCLYRLISFVKGNGLGSRQDFV